MQDVALRTAFVTGRASGIGFAMARSFAKAGMKVSIAEVEVPALECAEKTLREITPDVLALPLGVTGRDGLARAAEAIRNDDLYIFSHPEQRTDVHARHDRILAAFDHSEKYCATLAG
jgi:NAD(P)-dependent dehydrogenase (short-subunit alcohol dehydrogenase family)